MVAAMKWLCGYEDDSEDGNEVSHAFAANGVAVDADDREYDGETSGPACVCCWYCTLCGGTHTHQMTV